MNIINVEILDNLKRDKKILENNIFDLITQFEKKYEGSNIKLILPDNNTVDCVYRRTGRRVDLEVKINDQLISIK